MTSAQPQLAPGPFLSAQALVRAVNPAVVIEAEAHHDRLTKPRGALGQLEALGCRLSAIAGTVPPPVPSPAAVGVFAGDHGVVGAGVTPWPQEVTAQMVANFAGGGAAINVIARQVGASVTVVDVGVAADLGAVESIEHRNVVRGTANLADGPALTLDQLGEALDVGASIAAQLVDGGAAALVTGEMGIGNTTPSAAIIAAILGVPAVTVTGRGTGIDDEMLHHKIDVIDTAVSRLGTDPHALTVLAAVGGAEIAALVGFIVGGAAAGVPVVIDGVIAGAALLAASQLCPDVLSYCFAGHRSTEPGASAVLDRLGLTPILDLGMRLGEGSGACLAVPVLEAAARVMQEMATFDSAGVVEKA